ncbi:aminopeptidase P N-terminal domain-containing protein [Bacteriovorax sp. DB6_IX]|uniref:aminopeptidase P N-terminal domain-containing protein n=1 Tax=Bacteriovorax sp. DB6_IX TaxID=1353530 RepID=UPI00038A018B|nr:aminopeptidase P N-terminal domain-containing protein [Bacteriovorax sp. DB6_IX]EQC49798.1 aminopeptidase P, N-terminal domain protein [Bacteriovorax sp. DB6_IX]
MQSTDFANRRERLFEKMDNGIAVIASNTFMTRSNDTEFPFRQNSNFRYLTGINEPDSVLVLSKKDSQTKTYIFIRPNNELEEMWMGKRLGLEKAKDLLGADEAFAIEDFEKIMEGLLPGHKNLYVHFHERLDITNKVQKN